MKFWIFLVLPYCSLAFINLYSRLERDMPLSGLMPRIEVKFPMVNKPVCFNSHDPWKEHEITDGHKFNEFVRISRIKKNVLPVSLLCLISGITTRPHDIGVWITSPPFLAATIMVQMLSAASMVLNDIMDYEVDKINNPERPLPKGIITRTEASFLVVSLFSIYTYLGIQFLPPVLDPIWTTTLLIVSIYTPILKKICFVKNLACASIVALTVPFIGWSVINPMENSLPDFHWLILTMRIVFTSSLFIEMTLDITDVIGDRLSNIFTLPVLLGEPKTLAIINGILFSSYYVSLSESNSIIESTIIILTYNPFFYQIYRIYRENYDKSVVLSAIQQTTIQLGLYLLATIMIQQ